MRVVERLAELPAPAGGGRGLVPTMGYLHAGHQRLFEVARQENDQVVASVFVNPLQFGPREDLARYPRDPGRDEELAAAAGVDILFRPSEAEVYPAGYQTRIEVGNLAEVLCGAHRPGHFSGVATVVAKLFGIIRPDRAYFGEKDYQQALIVARVTRDLNLGVEIRTVPTVRETDGLAMSSRNALLGPEERAAAPTLPRALRRAADLYRQGERTPEILRQAVLGELAEEPLVRIEYVEVVDAATLGPPQPGGAYLVAAAVWLGRTRLIDNLRLFERNR